VATFFVPELFGDHGWLTLGDGIWTIQSAQYVANGGLGYVYSANVAFLPLPGFLLLLAPFAAVANHLDLVNANPLPLAHPSILPVMAPAFFIYGATAILGVDYLASTLGLSTFRRRFLDVATSVFVVVPTCCWTGHSEDLVALALSCLSLGLLIRRRHGPAAIALSVAILMQPWALLLIPLLVVAAPAGMKVRSLVYSSLLPTLTGLLLLALDWPDASRSLIEQPMQGRGQHLPWWSMSHPTTVVDLGVSYAVRVGSGPRVLAVLAAMVAAYWIRNRVTPRSVILVASVALVGRGLFETQVWCYYLVPGAVLLAVGAAMNPGRRRFAGGLVGAFVFYGCVAGAYAGYSMSALVGFALLVAAAIGSLVISQGRRHLPPRALHLAPVT
jgi:hypothetical protein